MAGDPFSFAAFVVFLRDNPIFIPVAALGVFLGFTSAGFLLHLVDYCRLCPHGDNCVHCALSRPSADTASAIEYAYARLILEDHEDNPPDYDGGDDGDDNDDDNDDGYGGFDGAPPGRRW